TSSSSEKWVGRDLKKASGPCGVLSMEQQQVIRLSGFENGHRIESRILEERIQQAVGNGCRTLDIEAFGQHGLGGRLWKAGNDRIHIRISGSPGQRVGSMGFPNTLIEVLGPSSDDV